MRTKFGFTLALFFALGFAVCAQDAAPAPSADAAGSASPIGTAVVRQDNINVRGQPSFIGEVITKLRKGDTVTILEEIQLKQPRKDEPTNWFRIALPANTPVWVFAEYIDSQTSKVLPNRLNLRAGPGENFSVVGRLQKGDDVKVISTKQNWMQIEAPPDAYAFVAAQFIEKQTPPPVIATQPPPPPAPAPEQIELPPAEILQPAEPEPAPVAPADVAQPAPALELPPITAPSPAPEQELPRRIVKREGIVSRAVSIQAPTYFELHSIDNARVINYLHAPEEIQVDPKTKRRRAVPLIDLREYLGRRIVVTGEELIDKRWPNTPVIEIETIDLVR